MKYRKDQIAHSDRNFDGTNSKVLHVSWGPHFKIVVTPSSHATRNLHLETLLQTSIF